MGKNTLALGTDFLCSDRMGNLSSEHFDFAAVGFSQQSRNLLGKVGAVVHHRQQDTVDLELGLICRFTLLTVWSSCSRPLAGRYSAWTGIMTLLAAANALTVSIPREG